MIRSMTGYGKGETVSARGRCLVEVRTVNHRYGEVTVKLPRSFLACEHELRKLAAARIKRGKADLFVQWEPAADAAAAPPVNLEAARGYHEAFRHLAHELRLSPEIPLSLIVSQRNVLQETVAEDGSDLLPQVLEAATAALDSLDAMRLQEGTALVVDLRQRRQTLEELVGRIRERIPAMLDEFRAKLEQRLAKLLGDTQLDPQRLAQEVAILADKSDVTEELVRLASHFVQFDETLTLREPVGRKLDFLMQELNREVNTIGSKSGDVEITSLVVALKAEMEKMREQVQNIE